MEIIFTKHRIFDYRSFGVESNVFQSLFADQIKKFSAENKEYLPVVEVGHSSNKELRIQSLQPLIKQGLLKIRSDWRDDRNYKELMNQFVYFPLAGHDDGPDAVEGAFSLLKKARRWKGDAFFHSTGAAIPIDGFSPDLDMKKFDMSTPTVQVDRPTMWGHVPIQGY
jgi:predicted phage terminase large subunit-like protein